MNINQLKEESVMSEEEESNTSQPPKVPKLVPEKPHHQLPGTLPAEPEDDPEDDRA